MSGAPTVTIAGAGALGLACAVALAEAGAAVTVCDPGGANASSVAAGMLAPVFEAALDEAARPHLDLLFAARDLWPGLAARAGVHLDRSGALAVGDAAWRDSLAAAFGRLGLRPTEIPAATARALAPGLATEGPALLTREDWRLDAPRALAALRAAAEATGVRFRAERAMGRGSADVLVVATGPAQDLAPELAQLSPIKGHIVRFAVAAVGATVRTQGAYAAPGEGVMALGATMEPGLGDARVDPAAAQPLIEAGRRLFPALADAPFDVAAGVRAATPDGLPLAGWSAEPGVIVAAGARRNGWLLAPLAARVVAACVTDRDPGPYARRLDPRRFSP
jgi:glycine oxidase